MTKAAFEESALLQNPAFEQPATRKMSGQLCSNTALEKQLSVSRTPTKTVRPPQKIGYARVSTEEQNLSLQIDALKSIGCKKIFYDQGISGNVTSRPGLSKALGNLKKDDELVVWRLDRLGRSLISLIKLLDELGQKNISFRSLNENIDTSSSGGKLVFHLMAALAEFERALISDRTKAGISSAKGRGIRIGRPPSLSRQQCVSAISMIEKNGRSLEWVARKLNVSERTLKRLIKTTKRTMASDIRPPAHD